MIIYHYNPETSEYLRSSEAKIDPLESQKQGKPVYRLPANATFEAPPVTGSKQVAVRGNDIWEIKEDHRGSIYYDKETASPIAISQLGAIPEELTPLSPPKTYVFWDGTQWAIDIEKVRTAKLGTLAAYRYQKETAGILVNGEVIRTDRESRSMITNTLGGFDLKPEGTTTDWETDGGEWVQVNKTTLETISILVWEHVEACFRNQKRHSIAITALKTAEEIENYDITTGWPEPK